MRGDRGDGAIAAPDLAANHNRRADTASAPKTETGAKARPSTKGAGTGATTRTSIEACMAARC